MKILRVIPSMNPKQGGPCQGIRNSIPEMKFHGVETEVVCFDSPDSDYLINDNFVVHAIGPAKGPYAFCGQLKSWLLENILRFDAVIIHGIWLHHSYGTYKVWQDLKKQGLKVPRLYVMPHGMLDPYFQKAKGRELKAIRNWIFWKMIERRVINNVDGLLFTCEEEMLLARKTFSPYNPQKELNVGYGILPPPVFSNAMTEAFKQKCPDWNGKPFLLFLSRIHTKKGVDLLIKAYLRLSQERGDMPQLIIAGPGTETSYGQHIVNMSQDCPNIKFCGMLSGDSKWGAFYNCEAFVLPSHQENFGIAIVEAMACAKAVLITDKVNIWREIESAEAGFVISDTEDAVYSLLSDWLSLSEDKKRVVSLNACKVYQQKFSTKEAVKAMLKAI